MALKLSIQDKATQAQAKATPPANSSGGPPQAQQAAQAPVSSGTTAATVSRVRALFDFQATDPDELTFRKGDIIAVFGVCLQGLVEGTFKEDKLASSRSTTLRSSQIPHRKNYREKRRWKPRSLAEIKNVEKLLTLLSTSTSELNVRDNEEITVC